MNRKVRISHRRTILQNLAKERLVLNPPIGYPIKYVILTFGATDNEVKYETLMSSLITRKWIGHNLPWEKCDAQLVVNETKHEYTTKE